MIMKTVPYDAEIEKVVLGSFMFKGQELEHIPRLNEDLFYLSKHRIIAKAIKALHESGNPYDLASVTSWLEDHKLIQRAGGIIYIDSLIESVVTLEALDYYLDILEENAIRRKMIHLASELLQKSQDKTQTKEELNEVVDSMVEELASRGGHNQKNMKEVVNETLDSILAEFDGPQGLSTGLADLDKKIKGLTVGSYIIAGRPGSGKTSLALNMALRQAFAGHKVGIISLEMPLQKLTAWMIDFTIKRDHSYIPLGTKKEDWLRNMKEVAESLEALPIIVDETSYTDVSEVISSAHYMRYVQGIEVLYIDYLQLLGARESRDGSREREVAVISRRLMALKKKLGIPVVTLCQLNRESTKKEENFRPKLHHLRESGALEQDADVVIMLHDPTQFGEDGPHEIHVTKNRSGSTTSIKKPIKVLFNKPAKRFENLLGD